MPWDERDGPVDDRTAHEPDAHASSSQAAYRRLDARAATRLRIAWLTVHAELLYDVDQSGQLSAQLLDLRDLLEAQDRCGS